MRLHRGTAVQLPDPLIEARQGVGNAPAYRNTAYVVFERLALDDFGNRIPVLQFEVVRAIGTLEKQIEAVTIIPGASEHGYAPVQVTETTGPGASRILNRNVGYAATTGRPRSTNCRRSARTSSVFRSSCRGSVPICAPTNAASCWRRGGGPRG